MKKKIKELKERLARHFLYARYKPSTVKAVGPEGWKKWIGSQKTTKR